MRVPAAVLLLLTGAAAHASAQQICTVPIESPANITVANLGTPYETRLMFNGQLNCADGSNLSAAQIQSSEITQILTLTGNVRYSDGKKMVTADNAQYFKTSGVLQARGNVVVTDIETKSRINAPALDYFRQNARTPEARMVTAGGRARASILRKLRSLGTSDPRANRDSTIVDADIIEIVGERNFHGTGNAVITRADMRGYGNRLRYDQDGGQMELVESARVESERYALHGDTIRAVLAEGEQLREVKSIRNARLIAEEIRVLSPILTIQLDSGTVQRLVATRPAGTAGQADGMPQVLSTTFNLSADSIDARAPDQKLERVDAVGHAFGERIDTLARPPQAAELPRYLTNDWVRGDTIVATFAVDSVEAARAAAKRAAAPTLARADSASSPLKPDAAANDGRFLQALVVAGKPATATLRMRVQDRDSTAARTIAAADSAWEFHHTLADRITVEFAKGEVANLDLKGNVKGLYLTPVNRTAAGDRRPGGS